MIPKPSTPRIHHPGGGPVLWAVLGGPRRTFDGDAGDVCDLTGRVPAGTREAGVSWSHGQVGPCLSFDGTGMVSFGTPAALEIYANLSLVITFKIKLSGYVEGCLFSKDSLVPNRGWSVGYQIQNTSGRLFLDRDGRSYIPGTPDINGLNTDLWHQVAFTLTGATDWRCHVDGVSWWSGTRTAIGPSTVTPTTIGGRPMVGYENRATALVADCQLYDRVLSGPEIARLAADPWWRLRPSTARSGGGIPDAPSATRRAPRWVPPRRQGRVPRW